MDKDLETCPVWALCGVARGLDYLFLNLLSLAKFPRPSAQRARCRQREAIATKLASGVLHARRRHVLLNKEKWKLIAIHTLHTVTLSWYLQTVLTEPVFILLNWCCYNYALFMIIIPHTGH